MRSTAATSIALSLALLIACGASQATEDTPEPSQAARDPAPQAAPRYAEPSAEIARAELNLVLEDGLGRFLQGVQTQPHFDEQHRFVGFEIESLYPDDPRFAAIDLRAGDVVTQVNGFPIERPEDALVAWDSLRVSSELVVSYLRGGEARELRFAIVD